MTDETDNNEWGIDRRTVLKSAALASVAGFVGVPALSGSTLASSHNATMTLVSSPTTMVTRRRAGTGENAPECVFQDIGENAVSSWEHPAWANTTACFEADADWIWYSTDDKQVSESDEYYVQNNVYGEVVEFERTFTVNGPPVGGALKIAVDNGFEAYVNGKMVASRAVSDGEEIDWECSDLQLPYVETDGWRTGGDCSNITVLVPAAVLVEGQNTLTVLAVNAHNRQGSEELEDGENPAGLIYELDVTYEQCEVCEGDMLAKYEWEDGEFVLEGDGDEYIELTDVTTDEDGEPVEACFATEYCNVDAVVKAGTEYEVYEDGAGEICVTGIEAENPGGQTVTHAISNVRFYCEAPEDVSVGNSGDPGRGHGKGRKP